MNSIIQQEITNYIETNIQHFHQKRLDKLQTLRLTDVVKRKNPYLFKTKNVSTVPEFVKNILDAHLSSQEETIFGKFLESLAIFVCSQVYGGRKSAAEGIDLEFETDSTKYIVSIKSGPNWGNSSQVKKLRDNFKRAKRILGTNILPAKVVAVNGCCYGKDQKEDKGDYLKLCGQKFWTFISGDDNLYTDIIEPMGHQAKEKKEQFREEYDKAINRLTFEFIKMFCDAEGNMLWEEIVKFNSADATS